MKTTALSSVATTRPHALRRLCCAVAVTLGLLIGTAPVPAQADEGNAIAEALFQEARELMRAKQYEQASIKFERSYKRDPKLGTLLNLAVCQQKLGRTATAWAHFKSAAAMAQRLDQQDRLKFARTQANELEAKLSRLRVLASNLPADARLQLDGEPFEADILDTALPLDPGRHTLSVTIAGKKPWSETIVLPAGPVEVKLQIPKLHELPNAGPRDATGSSDVAGAQQTTGAGTMSSGGAGTAGSNGAVGSNGTASSNGAVGSQNGAGLAADTGGGGVSPLAIVGFSVGGAGLLVGAITGGMALGGASELEQNCPNAQCPEDQHSTLDTTTTLSHVSTVSLVLGGVGVGLGVIGLLLPTDNEEAPERSTVVLEPWLMPMGAGVRGTF